jgi:hypothetical protein
MRVTDRARRAVHYAKEEAGRLGHDRVGTEHLLLALASEGEGVAARVLQEFGGCLLELREVVAARYAAGIDPEPFPPDRGPPPWEPPPPATDLLELRFDAPSTALPAEAPPLLVTEVDLRATTELRPRSAPQGDADDRD